MKMKKSLTPILIMAASLLLLTGCRKSFDHAGYLEALLDSIYKGEHEQIQSFTLSELDELEDYYVTGLEIEVDNMIAFMGYPDISEERYLEIEEFFADVFSKARYSIYSSDAQGYVELEIVPITIFSESIDALTDYYNSFYERNNNYEFQDISDEEFYDLFIEGVIEILNDYVEPLPYGDPVLISVSVEKDSEGIYSISEEEFLLIDATILERNID